MPPDPPLEASPHVPLTVSPDAPPERRPDPRRRPLDLSIYLVTDTRLCTPIGVAATVRRAVAAGVTVVQLRDPELDDAAFVRLGRQIRAALDGTGVPLIVNDRVHLVRVIGADGAHVGQGDLPSRAARELLGPGPYLGLSVNSPGELAAAVRDHPGGVGLDYLGVGIYKPTPSKVDHAPAGGLDWVRALAAASPWPTCAIGGIKAADVAAIRRAGIDGVAVISAICGQPDIAAATRALVDAWDDGTAAAAPTTAPTTAPIAAREESRP